MSIVRNGLMAVAQIFYELAIGRRFVKRSAATESDVAIAEPVGRRPQSLAGGVARD